MAKFELKLPKMGESVAEATITSWLKEVGDSIEIDEAIFWCDAGLLQKAFQKKYFI
jgi:hypothetical protein